ncbi:MAG: PAS domain S-box protein [Leptospirillia bacterium]
MTPPKKDASEPPQSSLFQPFAPLLEAATDGIHILDPQGVLVAASRLFFEMLGYTPPELLGSHVSTWDAHYTGPELADNITRTLALSPNHTLFFESLHRKKDGSILPVEIRAASFSVGDHRFAFFSSRDITEKLAGEKVLRQLREFTELLAKVNRTVVLAHDRDRFFQEICDLAVEEAHLPLAWIGHPGEEGFFDILARSGESVGYLDRVRIPADPQKSGILGPSWTAFTTGRPLVNESLGRFFKGAQSSAQTVYIEAFAAYGLGSFVVLPVGESDHVRNIFALYHHATGVFTPEILAILQELSRGISLGISRIEARAAEHRNRTLREALLENTIAGILLLKDRTIVEANRRMAEILGYPSPAELAGLPTRVLYNDQAEYFRVGAILYSRLTQETQIRIGELHGRRKDGSELWAEGSATMTMIDGEPIVVVTLLDVTLRHRQSSRLARLSDFTVFFARANQLLTDAHTFEEMAIGVCERARQIPGVLLAWVGDMTTPAVKTLAVAGTPDLLSDTLIQKVYEETFRRPDLPQFLSAGEAPDESSGLLPPSAGSMALMPLQREDSPFGALLLFHREREVFDTEIRSLLEELARNISKTLERLAISEREKLLSAALASVSDGATVTDSHGYILYANAAFSHITGYSPEELEGRTLAHLRGPGTDPKTLHEISRAIRKGEGFHGQVLNFTKEGAPFWNLLTLSPIKNRTGTVSHFVAVLRDISEIRTLSDQLEYQALHDPLTGLPNRRALESHLSRALARGQRNGTVTAIGLLDLNDFKPVNDTYGHEAGDRLLRDFARRAGEMLRDNDFLARLGGDEFVIVIEDLDPVRLEGQLAPLLARLHRTVEIPFEMEEGKTATVGMTMGLALAPMDSREPDELLRLADAAMYQGKGRKNQEGEWWQRGPEANETAAEEPFDPYGEEASRLLRENQNSLKGLVDRFVQDFYDHLAREPEASAIISSLTPSELDSLKVRQAEHLIFLLDPDTTRDNILARARQAGETHTLVGIEPSLLLQSKSLYSNLLVEHLTLSRLSPRDRYRIYLAADSRLHEDIREEIRTGTTVRGAYFELLALPLPPAGTRWIDAVRREINRTALLPGLRCSLLFRLDSEGVFQIEAQSGACSMDAALLMGAPGTEPVVDPAHPRGQGPISRAYRRLQTAISPAIGQDFRFSPWHPLLKKLGLRSAMAIPLLNSSGQAVAIVGLFGAYPNQFSSSWMGQFAQSFRHRMEQVWSLCNMPVEVVSREESERYRRELYRGGLAMYMQPVIDLRNGSFSKVEALARLVLPDGTLIMPNQFLPVLSGDDINWLFRQGLDQSLDRLADFEKEGLELDLSLNISPVTLLEPLCSEWVLRSLEHHGIPPSRLSLEILEDRSLDLSSQHATIAKLTAAGVRLSMDDLGAGYSSLQRLSSLPFDKIKVDQSLLAHIRTLPLETLGILGSIIQMGRELGYGVVVEGLEDPGMIEVAAILGARYGQGYSLARPMPADRILDWSRTRHLPPQTGKITSWVGALASHWQFMHSEESPQSFPLDHCPLTLFFHHKKLDTSPQAAWHVALHHPETNREEIGKKLTDWLVEKVRNEGKSFWIPPS